MFENVRVVVLDFDGTLVDTMGKFADLAQELLCRHYGIPPRDARRKYLETSGLPFAQQLEILFPGHAMNPQVEREFERRKIPLMFEDAIPSDSIEAVSGLRKRGFKVAVSSNNFQELVEQVVREANGLDLDLVLGARPAEGFYKGTPHFDFVCEHFGVPKEALLFVGDSFKDVERARQYGIPFIAKLGTFTLGQFRERYRDVEAVEKLTDLLELLT